VRLERRRKRSQFAGLRLLRRYAPRNDMRGRGRDHPVRSGLIRRVDRAKRSQFAGLRLLRRYAPRNDMRGRGRDHPVRSGLIRRVDRAKQSQFASRISCTGQGEGKDDLSAMSDGAGRLPGQDVWAFGCNLRGSLEM
jgi:hypothetical protein